MYTIINRNTGKAVGRRHRKLATAVQKTMNLERAIKQYAGPQHYLPLDVLDADDKPIMMGHPEYIHLVEAFLNESEAVPNRAWGQNQRRNVTAATA